MRGKTNLLEGEIEAWDPQSPEAFTRLAGTRLIRVNGNGTVTIRSADAAGTEDTVYPGWLAFRADGSGEDGAVFIAPGNVSTGAGTVWRVEQA
jgi:hypothetical protein